MQTSIFKASILLLIIFVISVPVVAADSPVVKKNKSGICHPKGGTYYSRTKNYTPYPSMKACLKSGGRRAKR